jgi:hypothetical protein
VFERGGAIEFAVMRPDVNLDSNDPQQHARGGDLVWRVKVLKLSAESMTVEAPMALGRNIDIEPGIELVGAISIGQNRWMFRTRNLGEVDGSSEKSRSHRALKLALPEKVRRCQRRAPRFDIRELQLPEVEVWPLLDPKTVILAERSIELAWNASKVGEKPDLGAARSEGIMPTVGPSFSATLMNLGGGGLGLRVEQEDAQSIARHRVFWIRMPLSPELEVPVCATGKVVHTHIDSQQRTYIGIAFDFTFNSGHQQVVSEQIQHYIERVQASQIKATSRAKAS